MSNFVRKGSVGRVNASRLYAFNETLKKDALRERTFWEESKDSHPINRWQYNKWKREKDELGMFQEKFEKTPVDQKFKIQKFLSLANMSFVGPLILGGYFVFCWLRHRYYGLTPLDGATALARGIQNLPRPPISDSN